jgi:septum site-determining protein MinC
MNALVQGTLLGGLYALFAAGLSLIFGVMRLVNIAHGDLIVLAAVSPGAELLADGNIHVYGPLRGRALAGIKGDANARIFCQQLAAEMVSIAGHYKVAEDLRRDPLWAEAVQMKLSGDVLNITRL